MTDAARADTFPKLLVRNARLYAGRPAYRHKDLGIWQVWTWGEVLAQARAYAAGLSRLGLERGDTIAIVGSNRPRLYWSVMAAQMLGAVPVPVYADAVADELAYVLAHADVRFAAVEDQEQVDKILSVSERLPKLEQVVYGESRGLRDYDHSRLHAIDDVIKDGHAALASEASGQRGDSMVRAPDTRPEPGSSARAAPALYRGDGAGGLRARDARGRARL
jgi:long-chain acyl-CoA synthetase